MSKIRLIKALGILLTVLPGQNAFSQETLPAWSEGTLDLHFIATGRGDASFYVLPDGTKILCDAGDVGTAWHVAQPDPSLTPGQWIAKYIKDFSADLPGKADVVDYFYLTHHHDDHFGSMRSSRPGPHGYPLSGITEVGEEIHFNKIIDRDIENLSYPSKEYYEKKMSPFFKKGVVPYWHYQRDSCGTVLEDFRIGERNQFKMVNDPKPYRKNFEIYNIASNGFIHTGKGHKVRSMSKDDPELYDENMFSCVFLMKYGKFTFYNGGDIPGGIRPGTVTDRDYESQVADLIGGHVTMLKPDHHGWKESMNPYLINKLSPDVVVVMCSQTQHPYYESFLRLIDPLSKGYPRKIFFTTDGSRERMGRELGYKLAEIELGQVKTTPEGKELGKKILGEDLAKRLTDELWSHVEPAQGHIVVRVHPGGNSYQVFVLDAKKPGYEVLYKTDVIEL